MQLSHHYYYRKPAAVAAPAGAYAGPEIASVGATASDTSATTLTLTKPTGLASGDLMVAFIATQDGDPSTTFSKTGWTAAATPDSGTASRTTVLYREADSGDAAASDFEFTSSGTSTTCGGFIYRITGAADSSPLDAVAQQQEASSGAPSPPASGSVASGDYLCLTSVSFENDNPITHPSGYTEDVELQMNYSRDATLAVASKELTAVTSETPGDWADVSYPYHVYTILVGT